VCGILCRRKLGDDIHRNIVSAVPRWEKMRSAFREWTALNLIRESVDRNPMAAMCGPSRQFVMNPATLRKE
jgi:hypothetical protein